MTPRKGDRVRVTFEAEYRQESGHPDSGHFVAIDPDGARFSYVPAAAAIEVIEDLRAGDVYLDAHGGIVYCHKVPAALDDGRPFMRHWPTGLRWQSADELLRPLTLLVRDGKPVTP